MWTWLYINLSCTCVGLVEASLSSQQSQHSHGSNVRQPFRRPRNVEQDQSCGTVPGGDPQNSALGRTVDTGPMRVIRLTTTGQQSAAITSTSSSGAGSGAVVGRTQKTSGTVSGTHGATTSNQLRQLKLTDAASLPSRVQQQLYLGDWRLSVISPVINHSLWW